MLAGVIILAITTAIGIVLSVVLGYKIHNKKQRLIKPGGCQEEIEVENL